jgi:hypothetical protein
MRRTTPDVDLLSSMVELMDRLCYSVKVNDITDVDLKRAAVLEALCAAANAAAMQQFVDSWLASYGGKGITS